MPRTLCIAKKDCLPYFKKGDLVTIVPILYEEDTLISGAVYGLFQDGKLVRILDLMYRIRFKIPENAEIIEMFPAKYALKGSAKSACIEVADGRQYPASIARRFADYFDKIDQQQKEKQ